MPFLLSGVVLGVVAQRLVRKVCPFCAVDDYLSEEELILYGFQMPVENVERVVSSVGTQNRKGCINDSRNERL